MSRMDLDEHELRALRGILATCEHREEARALWGQIKRWLRNVPSDIERTHNGFRAIFKRRTEEELSHILEGYAKGIPLAEDYPPSFDKRLTYYTLGELCTNKDGHIYASVEILERKNDE